MKTKPPKSAQVKFNPLDTDSIVNLLVGIRLPVDIIHNVTDEIIIPSRRKIPLSMAKRAVRFAVDDGVRPCPLPGRDEPGFFEAILLTCLTKNCVLHQNCDPKKTEMFEKKIKRLEAEIASKETCITEQGRSLSLLRSELKKAQQFVIDIRSASGRFHRNALIIAENFEASARIAPEGSQHRAFLSGSAIAAYQVIDAKTAILDPVLLGKQETTVSPPENKPETTCCPTDPPEEVTQQ